MNRKEYNWTSIPEIKQQDKVKPILIYPKFKSITLTPKLWENIIDLSSCSSVEIRAFTSNAVSIWNACKDPLRITQWSTKIVSATGIWVSGSSNIIDVWWNTAKVLRFRLNGIVLFFTAVSWIITLHITWI